MRKTVAKTNRRVVQTVAESPVAAGAQDLARRGRRTERGLVYLLLMFGRWVSQCIAVVIPPPFRRLMHSLGRGLLRAALDVFGFVSRWFRTRSYWLLIGGIPALILAMPLAFYMIRLPFQATTAMANRYATAAHEAMLNEDYQTAYLYNRKLRQLGVLTESADYRMALGDFVAGRQAEAIAAMKKLAPEDEAGYVPAHIWLANWYARFDPNKDGAEAHRLVTIHLNHALGREPTNPDALALRAAELHNRGQTDQALSSLQSIAASRPEHRLTLIRLYARQGRWQAAKDEAQKLIDHFQATDIDQLRAVDFGYWAEAHQVLGQPGAVIEVLENGLSLNSDNSELADRLYQASMARAHSIRMNLTGQYDEMLRLLIRAHQLRPRQNDPLFRLAKLTQDVEPIGSKARAAVQQLVESDAPPKELLGIMGSIIGNAGDYEGAVRYLNRALQLDPHNALVLNNLAYTLLKLGPAHHQRGLELIDEALQIRPEEASFHETRGQLLLSLGRYEEAIEDLNLALNGLGDIPDIHRGLATAYRQLEQPELADKHARRVDE